MLGCLIIKELREILTTKSFLLALALSLVTFPFSFYLMIQTYEQASGIYNATRVHDRQHGVSGKLTVEVAAPPCPLTIFACGASSSTTRPVAIGRRENVLLADKINADPKRTQEDLVLNYFSYPDFLFVTRLLISLFAILFSSMAICEEKENRTICLLLAQPVRRAHVLLAKWLSRFAVVSLIFLISFLIGLIQVSSSEAVTLDSEHWMRILLIFFVTLVYIGIFSQIGIFISTRTGNSTVAALSAMMAWVLLVLVIPTLASEIAGFLHPVPNSQQLQLMKVSAEREVRKRLPSQSPAEALRIRDKIRNTLDAIEDDYINRRLAQVRSSKRLGVVSPALAYSDCVLSLSNNNVDDEYAYYRQLRYYTTKISEYDKDRTQLLAEPSQAYLPLFNYRERDLLSSIKGSAPYFIGLLVCLGGLSWLSFFSFYRYDVR